MRGKREKVYGSIDGSIPDDLLALLQFVLADYTPGDNLTLASDYFANKASPEELSTAVDDLLFDDGKIYRMDNLPEELKDWCFDLFAFSLRPLYEQTTEKWAPKEFRETMFSFDNRLIVLHDPTTKRPIAFTVFSFSTYMPGVLICNELQVLTEYRSKRLGTRLLVTLNRLGEVYNMGMILLRAFSHLNPEAMRFYKRLGFEVNDDFRVGDSKEFVYMSREIA